MKIAIIVMVFCYSLINKDNCASVQYKIYWGDVHGHTNFSDGKESIDYYLTYARDTSKLDFVMVTDHDFGNGKPDWRMTKDNWNIIQDKTDTYTVNGKFVAIAGYEWTSQPKYWSEVGKNVVSEKLFEGPPKLYNHKNVYFSSRVDYLFSAKDIKYNSPDLLAGEVLKHNGLIQNNHPAADSSPTDEGKEQWEYNPSYYSVITNTEINTDVGYYNGKTYNLDVEQCVRDFLNKGGKTGFVKGTDTHESRPEARTAVLAKELTREAIFEALRHRRNYAVSNARIVLDFKINGHYMGEEIEINGSPEINIDVKGTDKIEEIAIIKDGATLYSISPKKNSVKFKYVDKLFKEKSYYYLRVIQVDKDKNGNNSYAWSSPIWIKKKH